jgi:hypothetical protein
LSKLIPTGMPKGQVVLALESPGSKWNECVGKIIRYNRRVFETTARHCVLGNLNQDEWIFFRGESEPDVAVREVDEQLIPEVISVADVNPAELSANLDGRFVLFNTIDRFKQHQTAGGFLIRITEPMLRAMYSLKNNRLNIASADFHQALGQYMVLLPPWHGENSRKSGRPHGGGESGTGLEIPGSVAPVGIFSSLITHEDLYSATTLRVSYTVAFFSATEDLTRLLHVALAKESAPHAPSYYMKTGYEKWGTVDVSVEQQ